ncbi:unnamed protein product [Caenorhabditis brenneri]
MSYPDYYPENFEFSYDYSPNYDENFTIPTYFENPDDETKYLIFISDIADFLEKLNLIFSFIGLFLNLAHFLVMIQTKMRNSSVNILMIGISICDILIIGNTVVGWIYGELSANQCWPKDTYLSRVVLLFFEFLVNLLLRVSPWLGLSMAVIRATVLLFPLNPRISKLSEKHDGYKVILVVFGLSFLISGFLFARFSVFKDGQWKAPEGCSYPTNYTQTRYIVLVGRKVIFSDRTSREIYGIVNGASNVIPAVLYPVIAVILMVQLWKMKRNHDKLFSHRENVEKDHTTILVSIMTITFFISQLPVGLSMWLALLFPFHNVVLHALDQGKHLTSMLFTLNATCHCVIFATLSSQYRDVAREMFRCGRQKKIVPVDSTTSGHQSHKIE